MHYLDEAAQFVHTLQFRDLPGDVVERARLILLDSMGVMIAGSREAHVGAMARALRVRGSNGRSLFLTDGRRGDAGDAALINGVSICAHVAEEGHKYARGHVAAYVVPAVLAVAEERNLGGAAFLAALVAAYELVARLGMACRVREGMHPSGTWGTVGCAAAVAKMMGLQPAQIRETMNVAAPLTLATSWAAAEEGALVRDLYSGTGGTGAVWAPRWVEAGVTGSADDVAGIFGKVSSETFDAAIVRDGLGTRWEILRNYFKVHACCRNFQSGIDVAVDLHHSQLPDTSAIRSITVDTFSAPALHNTSPTPGNLLAARESLPVSLALTLIHGKCDQSVYTQENVSHPEVRRLAALARINLDPDLDKLYPDCRPTRVTIGLASGKTLSGYEDVALGDPARPVSEDLLRTKFHANASSIGANAVAKLEQAIAKVETLDSISALTQCLVPSDAMAHA